MRKIIIMGVAILLFSMANIANAQIGVDLEDVAKEMTAAKTQWSKDVELDSIFPKYDGVFYHNVGPTFSVINSQYYKYPSINMLGDTVVLSQKIVVKEYNHRSDADENVTVYYNGEIKDTLLSGKYVVTGYVIFKENRDSLRKIHPELPEVFVGTVDDCKRQILHGEKIGNFLEKYCAYVRLSGIDTINDGYEVYMCSKSELPFVNLKYYNLLSSRFLNKNMYFFYDVSGRKSFYFSGYGQTQLHISKLDNNIYIDQATKKEIKLLDTIFTCKKIIVASDGEFYIVLSGEKTGSFTLKIKNADDCYSYNENFNSKYYKKPFTLHMGNEIWDFTKPDRIIEGLFVEIETGEYLVPIEGYKKAYKMVKDAALKQKKIEDNQAKQREQERQRKRAEKRQQIIAKYGAEMGQLINDGNIRIGMTKAMCKEAWGTPWDTYRTTTAFGTSEVWVYNYKTRVYFQNNKIVKIED